MKTPWRFKSKNNAFYYPMGKIERSLEMEEFSIEIKNSVSQKVKLWSPGTEG